MKIVIGGGAGFIGASLGRVLASMGHQVTAADDLSTGFRSSRDSSVSLAKGRLEQPGFMAKLFGKVSPDLYIHAAGQRDIVRSWEDPDADLERTGHGFVGVLEAWRSMSLPRILLLSTGEVLSVPQGGENAPLAEGMALQPVSPYGVSHALCEFHLDNFSRWLNTKATIVRLSPVYGPRQTTYGEGGVIGTAIRQMLLESPSNPPTIPGHGLRVRDPIFIDDAVEGLLQIILQERTGTFHLGSGLPCSDRDLFHLISHTVGFSYPVHYQAIPWPEVPMRVLGHERLALETDWKPEVSLEEGIARTVEFFRSGVPKQ